MTVKIQAPRRDDSALDGYMFSERAITFFEDVEKLLTSQDEVITSLQEEIEFLEQRIAVLEGYH